MVELHSNTVPIRYEPENDHNINTGGDFSIIASYPQKPIPQIAQYIPENVERTLNSAEAAYLGKIYDGAAGLYRKAMERALKGITEEKGMLAAQIKKCSENGLIPTAMAEWLDHVRLYGNDAIHEEDFEPTKEEVEDAREFAHLFLVYTFTMPEKVRLASIKRDGDDALNN